jgi:hypothetical protein
MFSLEERNDWINSDDIDFSGFMTIDESRLNLGISTTASSYRKVSAPVSDGDDDDGEDDGNNDDDQGYRRNRRSVKFEDEDDD